MKMKTPQMKLVLLNFFKSRGSSQVKGLGLFIFLIYLSGIPSSSLGSNKYFPGEVSRISSRSDIAPKWVFDKTVKNVDFYHSIVSCNGKNVVLLKFNNRNNRKVRVAWKEAFDTQREKGIEGFLGQKQLELRPGITAQTNCNSIKFKEGIIQSHQVNPTYAADVLKFNYKDISVTKL